MKKIIVVLLFVTTLAVTVLIVAGNVMPANLKRVSTNVASANLVSQCDSIHKYLVERRDPLLPLLGESETLAVKCQTEVQLRGKLYFAAIIGCVGPGEFVLVDSSQTIVKYRKPLNLPGMHASFGDFKDLNADGNPELQINLSGGAHGFHECFLSLFPDSAVFILNENGGTIFTALTGDITTMDRDGDGLFEIVVDCWSTDPQKRPQKIYKITGQRVTLYQKIDK